jgi:hypothetical protein
MAASVAKVDIANMAILVRLVGLLEFKAAIASTNGGDTPRRGTPQRSRHRMPSMIERFCSGGRAADTVLLSKMAHRPRKAIR